MERAARERAEEEEKERRLADLRAPKRQAQERRGGGGGFPWLGGAPKPQACETSYDCERPMVCCDLLFGSVCCSGGLLIPTTDSVKGMLKKQPQAIPIPVEKDDPNFPPGVPQGPGQGPTGLGF